MKIAITGANGRVGNALVQHFRSVGHEVFPLTRQSADLTSPTLTQHLDPSWDVLYNPAALSSPDDCEADPALAQLINTEAPKTMAAWCAHHQVRFVHFSTDYVFSGDTPGKRRAEDTAEPNNCYGITKRQGETAVLAACPQALIARVSWIYGAQKPGFVDTLIEKFLRGDTITAIADKYSLPTHMSHLTLWLEKLLATPASGIVHACHRGEPVSWHGLAQFTLDELKKHRSLPQSTSLHASTLSQASHFRAPRPIHTAMDNTSLEHWIGPVSEWSQTLRQHLASSCSQTY